MHHLPFRALALVFLAFLSFLALKEYLSMIPTRRADHRVLFWAYLCIPLQYYWISRGWYGLFIVFIPVFAFLFLAMRMLLIGETRDFLRSAGTLHWGLMITVFSLSHMAYLLVLPGAGNPHGGGPALLLYLVFLTQFNDIGQHFLNKSLGRHKIASKVSPDKSWKGFLGGLGLTVALAVLLAGLLTPLHRWEAAGAGFLIGLGGFFGDATISAIKRDLGLKDGGSLFQGQGGILNRIGGLTYSAPLFFHYLHYLYY